MVDEIVMDETEDNDQYYTPSESPDVLNQPQGHLQNSAAQTSNDNIVPNQQQEESFQHHGDHTIQLTYYKSYKKFGAYGASFFNGIFYAVGAFASLAAFSSFHPEIKIDDVTAFSLSCLLGFLLNMSTVSFAILLKFYKFQKAPYIFSNDSSVKSINVRVILLGGSTFLLSVAEFFICCYILFTAPHKMTYLGYGCLALGTISAGGSGFLSEYTNDSTEIYPYILKFIEFLPSTLIIYVLKVGFEPIPVMALVGIGVLIGAAVFIFLFIYLCGCCASSNENDAAILNA